MSKLIKVQPGLTVIAKIKPCSFLTHSVYWLYVKLSPGRIWSN